MQELLEIARGHALEVRLEPFDGKTPGPGGLCWVSGRPLVLLNTRVTRLEQSAALAQALRQLRLDPGPASLEARMFVAAQSPRGLLLPQVRPRPGLAKTRPARPGRPK